MTDRARLFDDLIETVDALRQALDSQDGTSTPDARRTRDLERLAERYQDAADAVSHHVEQVIKRTSGRART